MKKIMGSIAVVVFLALACTSVATAGHGKKKAGLDEKFLKKAHFMLMYQEELGLSKETEEAIKELKVATKKALVKQNAEIDVLAIDIKAALYNQKIDVEAVNTLIDQKYALKKDRAKLLVSAMAELKGMLNDDQYAKMISIWREKEKAKSCKRRDK